MVANGPISTPSQAASSAAGGAVAPQLKILSLSTCYPNPLEPNLGIFVHRRLDQMSKLAQVRVIAPVPLVDYGSIRVGKGWSAASTIPGQRQEGSLQVAHPRWWYPPGGGLLNPYVLALQLRGRIRKIQREYPFDVLDAHFAYPNGIAAGFLAKWTGRPFTMTLRGNEPMHAESAGIRRWTDWALRRAAIVFAVSGRLAEWAVSRGVAEQDVYTVPNGVDTTVFRQNNSAADGEQLRREIGAEPNARIILSVGYLIERKGHHQLIRAAHQIRERASAAGGGAGTPAVHVVIAGEAGREGRFEDNLRSLVTELGVERFVHFLGRQPQQRVAKLMNAADMLVLASTREGWPNVVQESLACGCPVIATDIGGTPDMLPDRRYGYVVPSNAVEHLTPALREALERPWDRKAIAEWGGRRSWHNVASDVVTRMQSTFRVNR